MFQIPQDYQDRTLQAYRQLQAAYDDRGECHEKLTAQLDRVRNLYKWGDIAEEEYQKEKHSIQPELRTLTPVESQTEDLGRLASFLANVAKAWEAADGAGRNKLTRVPFQEVWLRDKEVVAVKSQPELEPFFKLNYDEFVNKVLKMRPRRDSNPRSPP